MPSVSFNQLLLRLQRTAFFSLQPAASLPIPGGLESIWKWTVKKENFSPISNINLLCKIVLFYKNAVLTTALGNYTFVPMRRELTLKHSYLRYGRLCIKSPNPPIDLLPLHSDMAPTFLIHFRPWHLLQTLMATVLQLTLVWLTTPTIFKQSESMFYLWIFYKTGWQFPL